MERSLLPALLALVVVAGGARLAAAEETPRALSGVSALIREGFQAHLVEKREALVACHAETASRGAALVTHLVFLVRVFPDGTSAVRIVDRTRRDRAFERCVLGALGAPSFPPPGGESSHSVLYDQVFTSEGPILAAPAVPPDAVSAAPAPGP